MSDITHDMALDALLEARRTEAPEIPEQLVRDVYAIQRRYQFDHDSERAPCVQELQKLIEQYATPHTHGGDGGSTS